ALRREQQMHMVGHYDIGVQLIVANGAVVQKRIDEEFSDARDLKHRTAIACRQGDKRNSGSGWPRRLRHKNLNGKEGTGTRTSHKRGVLWSVCVERVMDRALMVLQVQPRALLWASQRPDLFENRNERKVNAAQVTARAALSAGCEGIFQGNEFCG